GELIAEVAMGDERDVDAAEDVDGRANALLVAVEVGEIAGHGRHGGRGAPLRDVRELLRIPPDQVKPSAALGIQPRGLRRDRRGGPEDEHAFHGAYLTESASRKERRVRSRSRATQRASRDGAREPRRSSTARAPSEATRERAPSRRDGRRRHTL